MVQPTIQSTNTLRCCQKTSRVSPIVVKTESFFRETLSANSFIGSKPLTTYKDIHCDLLTYRQRVDPPQVGKDELSLLNRKMMEHGSIPATSMQEGPKKKAARVNARAA